MRRRVIAALLSFWFKPPSQPGAPSRVDPGGSAPTRADSYSAGPVAAPPRLQQTRAAQAFTGQTVCKHHRMSGSNAWLHVIVRPASRTASPARLEGGAGR